MPVINFQTAEDQAIVTVSWPHIPRKGEHVILSEDRQDIREVRMVTYLHDVREEGDVRVVVELSPKKIVQQTAVM